MSTTKPAPRWQELRKASGSDPEAPQDGRSNLAPSTPKPRVLARFPDLDAPEPAAQPAAETAPGFPDFEGRIINQKLAGRILAGVAVVLVLTAVLPLALRRDGSKENADEAAAKPSWQPENPAPEAAVAPAWNDAATEVGERTQPREQVAVEPPTPLEPSTPADPPEPSPLRDAERTASREPAPLEPEADSAAQTTSNGAENAAANQKQSIAPRTEGGFNDAPDDRFQRPDWTETDRRHPAATTSANRETAIPDAGSPGADDRDPYQPAQPEPSYGREPRGDSGYDPPAHAEYRHTPRWGDYRPAPETRYHSAPETRYHSAPETRYHSAPETRYHSAPENDYRSASGHDHRAAAGHDHRAAAGHDHRAAAGHDHRAAAGHDHRAAAGHDHRAAAGHDHRAAAGHDYRAAPMGDYRSPPGAEYRSPSAAQMPVHPYQATPNSHQPTPNAYRPAPHTQSPPDYHDGGGARTGPSGTSSYYQADQRYGAPPNYAPYGGQPGEARFQGTIEPAPAPNRYDNSGSRLY